MCLGELADDGEAETGATVVAVSRVVEPGEPLEDPLPVLVGDARAIIRDAQRDPIVRLPDLDVDLTGSVAHGVVHEIADQPLDGSRVRHDPGPVRPGSLPSRGRDQVAVD